MSELSRKWLREGIELAVAKGVAHIVTEEVDFGRLIQNIAKGARMATVARAKGTGETKVRVRDLGEALVSVVRSVDSFSDLQMRVNEHKGEFVDAARHFSQELYVALQHLGEPSQHDTRTFVDTLAQITKRSRDDSASGGEPHKSQDSDT